MNRWANILWAHGPGGGTRYYVTPSGSAELIFRHLGDWSRFKVREVEWNDGRIRSLEDPENGGTTMVWEGPHDEVFHGTNVPIELFMDKLERFDIQHAPDGLTMLPRAGSGVKLGNLLASNVIDQLCSVQIKPVSDVAQIIPRSTENRFAAVRCGASTSVTNPEICGPVRHSSSTTAPPRLLSRQRPDDPRFVSVVDPLNCSLN